jgi:hypothetical protein
MLNQTGLSNSWWSLEKNTLVNANGMKDSLQVGAYSSLLHTIVTVGVCVLESSLLKKESLESVMRVCFCDFASLAQVAELLTLIEPYGNVKGVGNQIKKHVVGSLGYAEIDAVESSHENPQILAESFEIELLKVVDQELEGRL